MTQFEITLEKYEKEIAQKEKKDDDDTSALNLNSYIGKEIFNLVIPNVVSPISQIYEYDTQIIEKNVILRLVDNHYLLFNKMFQ